MKKVLLSITILVMALTGAHAEVNWNASTENISIKLSKTKRGILLNTKYFMIYPTAQSVSILNVPTVGNYSLVFRKLHMYGWVKGVIPRYFKEYKAWKVKKNNTSKVLFNITHLINWSLSSTGRPQPSIAKVPYYFENGKLVIKFPMLQSENNKYLQYQPEDLVLDYKEMKTLEKYLSDNFLNKQLTK